MAKVPTYQSEGRLPAHPLASQVNPAAMTQDLAAQAQMGQAIAGLGSKVLAAETAKAEKLKKSTEDAQAADLLNQQRIFDSQFEESLNGDNDPTTWRDRYRQQSIAKGEALLGPITDPNQKLRVQADLQTSRTITEGRVASAAVAKDNDLKVDNLRAAHSFLIADGRPMEAFIATEDAYAEGAGIISEAERQSMLGDAAAADAMLQGYEEGSKMLAATNKGGAFKHYGDLSVKQRQAAQNRLNYWNQATEDKTVKLQDIYTEQSHKSVIAELAKEPTDIGFLSDYSPEVHDFWIAQTKKDLNTLDPSLYNAIKQQIREDPDSVNYLDIVNSVGNGLPPKEAEELLSLQDKAQSKDSPLRQPHVVRAHDRISDLQGIGMSIGGVAPPNADSSPKDALRYYNLFDEWHANVDRNADLSPEAMRKYTDELVAPAIEKDSRGFFDYFWGGLQAIGGYLPISMGTKLSTAYVRRERAVRTRPRDRGDFETKFKQLYEVNPETANRFWDRWNEEL